jgi:hypothetical protein
VCLSAVFAVSYILLFLILAAVPSDVTCKPLTSVHTKKVQHRNSSKLSSGTVVPLILGSKSEGMIGSSGVQLQESSEVGAMPGAESAKMKSSTSTLVSLNKTYVEEAVIENRSEVDNVKFSDRNLMAGVTQKAGLTSGTKSLEPLSLFDPDIPLTLIGDGYNEATPSDAVTNRNGSDLMHIMDNSDCISTITRVESPEDMSLCIENIMEEMRSIPNPLSPVAPEPETSRSHGQSTYYLTGYLCLQNSNCLTQGTCNEEVRSGICNVNFFVVFKDWPTP